MIIFRWLSILCGIAIFIWSSTESTNIYIVMSLGLSLASLVTWFYKQKFLQLPNYLLTKFIQGGTVGILTGGITALLMLFKNVRHAHQSPDFPFEQITAMLIRSPVWAIVGGLIWLSIGLLWKLKETDDQS